MSSWRSLTKITGYGAGSGFWSESRSVSQRYGFADTDPDPYQDVTDPQHWLEWLRTMKSPSSQKRVRLRKTPSVSEKFGHATEYTEKIMGCGVRSPKFIWAPCVPLYSLTETPQPSPHPHLYATYCNTTIYHRLRLIASAVGKDFNLRLAKNKANIYQVNAKIMQCHVLLCKKVTFTCHVKHKQWPRLHMSPLHTVYNIKRKQMVQTVL